MAASPSSGEPAKQRPAYAAMRTVNPAVIPRNHRVEEALSAAEDHDDLSVLHRLLSALAMPYEAGDDSVPIKSLRPMIAAT